MTCTYIPSYALIIGIFIILGWFTITWLENNLFSIEREKILKENCIDYPLQCDNVIYEWPQFVTTAIILAFVIFALITIQSVRLFA